MSFDSKHNPWPVLRGMTREHVRHAESQARLDVLSGSLQLNKISRWLTCTEKTSPYYNTSPARQSKYYFHVMSTELGRSGQVLTHLYASKWRSWTRILWLEIPNSVYCAMMQRVRKAANSMPMSYPERRLLCAPASFSRWAIGDALCKETWDDSRFGSVFSLCPPLPNSISSC